MSSRVRKATRAKADLVEQFEFIGKNNPEAAERFLDAAEAAFKKLARMPRMGAHREYLNPRLSGLRMWPVPEFPHALIFYRSVKDAWGYTTKFQFSSAKAEADLGYTHGPLRPAIADAIAWFRAHALLPAS